MLISGLIILSSCSQNEGLNTSNEPLTAGEEPVKAKHNIAHSYGGWYCPDNILGFPPVNILDLEKVPVVNGRLPTREETRNGISLMYFDTTHIPSARPLDMKMPRVARYYSDYTKKNELVVVIQAVEAEGDTVVGFRYLNGGNGSAWFDEVTFLSKEETNQLGSMPFVSFSTTVNASKEKVWEVMTSLDYEESLGKLFGELGFSRPTWRKGA